jgi:DNA-nicking Smr family endonuclease
LARTGPGGSMWCWLMKKPNRKFKADNVPDGADLWQHVTEQVSPLKGRETLHVDLPEPVLEPKSKPMRRKGVIAPSPKRKSPPKPPPELTHTQQPDMDKRNQQRLRQGKLKIDSRTDLHGMTQVQAHRALGNFIVDSWNTDKRLVLIITGKGLRPDGATGVLRSAVPRWLNESPNREKIIGFSYAAPKDGGEGALYVRLKKSPSNRK